MTSDPPSPHGVGSLDDLVTGLQLLRAWAGVSYRELHRRVVRARRDRGVAELPAYATIYRCLQPGRTRLDAELVADIAGVLTGDVGEARQWRQAYRHAVGEATSASIVTVSDTLPDDVAGFAGRSADPVRADVIRRPRRLLGGRQPMWRTEWSGM